MIEDWGSEGDCSEDEDALLAMLEKRDGRFHVESEEHGFYGPLNPVTLGMGDFETFFSGSKEPPEEIKPKLKPIHTAYGLPETPNSKVNYRAKLEKILMDKIHEDHKEDDEQSEEELFDLYIDDLNFRECMEYNLRVADDLGIEFDVKQFMGKKKNKPVPIRTLDDVPYEKPKVNVRSAFKLIPGMNYMMQFKNMAEFLLNHCNIVTKKYRLMICDVEFFVRTTDENGKFEPHEDPYVELTPERLTNGMFNLSYGVGFKANQHVGLEITIGDGVSTYGSIFIQAVRVEGSDESGIVEGTQNTGKKILFGTDFLTWPQFYKKHGTMFACDDETMPFYLEAYYVKPIVRTLTRDDIDFFMEKYGRVPEFKGLPNRTRGEETFMAPRVRLSLKGVRSIDDARMHFVMRPYRFVICPDLLKVEKYMIGLFAMKEKRLNTYQIAAIFGMKRANFEKLVEFFNQGLLLTWRQVVRYGIDEQEMRCRALNVLVRFD